MQEQARTPRNADQLRDDIDSGRTGDKVPAGDPAAAPLGTDDEAGGASTPVHGGASSAERVHPGPVRAHSLSSRPARISRVTMIVGAGVVAALLLGALFAI